MLGVVPVEKGEISKAKKYWESLGDTDLGFYDSEQPWSRNLGEFMKQPEVMAKSVFEYGCHVGRNLRVIRDVAGCKVSGIDVNKHAIQYGKKTHGLNLKIGDHNSLKKIKNNAFDVCVTVSALDHTPAIDVALGELVRISRRWLVMVEPFEYGAEGKLIKHANSHGVQVDATPFTYIWDYEGRLVKIIEDGKKARKKEKIKEFTIDPMPLSGVNLGPYYKLIIVKMK